MLEIRKATLEDLPQLTELFNSYRIFYHKKPDLIGAELFLKERLQNKESVIYVAEENKILTGFTQLYPIFSSTRMKRLWLLNDLFVDENHRNKGISKLLIDQAKILCIETNACGMFLETDKTNVVGNKLYPTCGFKLNTSSNFYEWNTENV